MFILYIVLPFIISLSVIGYGFILTKFLNLKHVTHNIGLVGIIGLFFLSIISSYTHLFFAHGYIHNVIIIFFGLIYLFYIKKKKFIEYKILILLFLILFISFIFSKNNEDFPYYHLPNSIQFAQQKLQFGLGNLNHGFKHISSLFLCLCL